MHDEGQSHELWWNRHCEVHCNRLLGLTFSGVECYIGSNIYTIKGGAINEVTLKKGERVAQIVEENRLPCINLVESVYPLFCLISSSLFLRNFLLTARPVLI